MLSLEGVVVNNSLLLLLRVVILLSRSDGVSGVMGVDAKSRGVVLDAIVLIWSDFGYSVGR